MVTYPQLRAARPDAWHGCALALRRLASVTMSRSDSLGAPLARLRAGWTGVASDAAEHRLNALTESLADLHPVLLAADQILADHAGRVTHAQRMSDVPDGVTAAAAVASARVTAAIDSATVADSEAAGRLRALLPGLEPPTPEVVGAPSVPPPGSDPGLVRRWWQELPESQRRWLLVYDPGRLGRLDGVPSAARDQANRLALTRERDRLLARRLGSGKAARAEIDATLRGLDALRDRLSRDQPARAYLLGFDATDDGRAVVAVGDPDRSADVLTYVPGAGSSLAGVDRLLASTDRLATHSDRPSGAAAVVLWLGYDAPDNPLAAAGAPTAHAEADLDRFTDGLRATHEGGRAHQSVLGHSFGSTMVGYTAAARGLDADDLIFVGSPGVGTAHAGDLGVPAGHVWSSTARHDPIRLTAAAHEPPLPLRWPVDPGGRLWFGADPSRSNFGGQVFASDPGSPRHPFRAHSGYFNEGNDALDDIAAIAVGNYDAVR